MELKQRIRIHLKLCRYTIHVTYCCRYWMCPCPRMLMGSKCSVSSDESLSPLLLATIIYGTGVAIKTSFLNSSYCLCMCVSWWSTCMQYPGRWCDAVGCQSTSLLIGVFAIRCWIEWAHEQQFLISYPWMSAIHLVYHRTKHSLDVCLFRICDVCVLCTLYAVRDVETRDMWFCVHICVILIFQCCTCRWWTTNKSHGSEMLTDWMQERWTELTLFHSAETNASMKRQLFKIPTSYLLFIPFPLFMQASTCTNAMCRMHESVQTIRM